MQILINLLKPFTAHKDRHLKGHAIAFLKRLQEINPLDEE